MSIRQVFHRTRLSKSLSTRLWTQALSILIFHASQSKKLMALICALAVISTLLIFQAKTLCSIFRSKKANSYCRLIQRTLLISRSVSILRMKKIRKAMLLLRMKIILTALTKVWIPFHQKSNRSESQRQRKMLKMARTLSLLRNLRIMHLEAELVTAYQTIT